MDRNDGKRSRAAEDCAVWSSVRARGAGWDGPPFLPSLIAPEEAVPPVWPLQPHTWPQCTVTCSPAVTHLPLPRKAVLNGFPSLGLPCLGTQGEVLSLQHRLH